MHIIPTILCGGAGSRLWPVSRESHPKPFIQLSDGQSLLQKAFIRGAALPSVDEILTVTNEALFFKTQEAYRAVNPSALHTSFILEPFGKNTTAAIAAAALYITEVHGENAIMLILAADHLIKNQNAFEKAIQQAAALAKTQRLVTFGIQPHRPETGYGYIEKNLNQPIRLQTAAHQPEGYTVSRFVEKPSKEDAQAYIDSGHYLWNSGMFCFTAASVLKQMALHCADILESTTRCFNTSPRTEQSSYTQIRLDALTFAEVRDHSFDYAIMQPAATIEQNSTVAVVPCDIGWTDIGSWHAIGELSTPDDAGNCVKGQALLYNSTNCYIHSDERLVGTVGVNNLMIIDTPDALLVVNKHHAQDVKHLYAKLKAQGHDSHKLHRTVHRPWGTYTVLEEGPGFKIKRIVVKPGASLSLQMHHHRSEHWIVVSGIAEVTNGDREFLVRMNESTHIPAGHQHRLENPGLVDLVMIEVQSGEYLGEDDIVRFADNYGRV